MKTLMNNTLTTFLGALIVALAVPLFASAYLAGPIAITKGPLNVTEKSVQLTGQVNSNEVPDTYEWFEWGVSGKPDVVYETPHRKISTGNKLKNVSETITGLAPSTQYFYRQVAESSRGKDVGQMVYVTTKPLVKPVVPILIVETREPISITENSVTLQGYVSPHGNTNARYWFEWGKTMSLENKTTPRKTGTNSAPVKVGLTDLEPGTSYFYRIVGETDMGIVYGAMRVVVIHGTPVSNVASEQPKSQSIPSASASGDSETRQVTTSGKGPSTTGVGSFFDVLLGKKKSTTTPQEATSSAQVAHNSASTPLSKFWNTLSGNKPVLVSVEKVGPNSVPAHTAVEYRVTYAYRLGDPASNAQLKIVLPENVVYIGDNTTNELLLEDTQGPERTYVLPVGRLENGSTRTVSILGMTTGAANGTFPDARARLEYTDVEGVVTVVAAGDEVATKTDTTTSSFSILPHSIIGWVLYLVLVSGMIIAVRKAKSFYETRKAEIAKEEELSKSRKSEQGFPPDGLPTSS